MFVSYNEFYWICGIVGLYYMAQNENATFMGFRDPYPHIMCCIDSNDFSIPANRSFRLNNHHPHEPTILPIQPPVHPIQPPIHPNPFRIHLLDVSSQRCDPGLGSGRSGDMDDAW